MESSESTARVLIVAHRTAATQPLLDAVRQRALGGPCRFTLLVPKPVHGLDKVLDPESQSDEEAQAVIDNALPKLTEAARGPVDGIVGSSDPSAAVQDALNLGEFDEVIISTLSPLLSRWLRLDLPHKVAALGVPVTTITPADEKAG